MVPASESPVCCLADPPVVKLCQCTHGSHEPRLGGSELHAEQSPFAIIMLKEECYTWRPTRAQKALSDSSSKAYLHVCGYNYSAS